MKTLMTALVLMGCLVAEAKDITMICQMGHAGDMDIKMESLGDNKEKLTVVLSKGMSGEYITKYLNSGISDNFLTKSLKAGALHAIVSESDLDVSFGGSYEKAGLLTMRLDKTGRYEVQFAAESIVYTASCK